MTKTLISALVLSGGALLSCSTAPPAASPTPDGTSAPTQAAPASDPRDDAKPAEQEPSNPIRAAVAAPDRSAEDRELDPQRKPVELLSFFGVGPGDRVAELAAGKGYTAELLARIVGPEGTVYGQNSPFILQRFAEGPWTERLQKPVMQNVVRVDSELETPLPSEATNLDAVFLILFYHDTVWFETDRAEMNAAIYSALRPGGVYAIVDHSAAEGAGVSQAKSLHRIEESVLRKEIEKAGFRLDASSEILSNPDDARDWSASPSAAGERRGESDRFVLRFVKPEGQQTTTPDAEHEPKAHYTACGEPRSEMCTREYRPVCAEVDTKIRCIKAPCPSTERKTYSNACTACADENVVGHVPGACPTSTTEN